jgi:type IV secretory pathway TraG/TraD family ATPase VirD4
MSNDLRPVWPGRFPVYRFGGLVLALVCGGLLVRAWILFAAPLERFYLRTYVMQAVLGDLPSIRKKSATKLVPVAFAGRTPATETLLEQGRSPLAVRLIRLDPAGFEIWLQRNIYGGLTPLRFFAWPLAGFVLCLVTFGACGAVLDQARNREARHGRRLRGPRLVTRWQFNRETRGDGLGFRTDNRRNLIEWFTGACALRIRRDREAHHIQIAGDTGSGKSTLVREILYEVEARGETAIVFDPDREYMQEFFDAGRGDWVLNPKDERCPYWPIGDEADDEATATPIANGLFPEEPTLQKFFLEHTRAIFAYLLASCRPTVSELAWWMAHPEEIDKRVKGTEHEHTLTANAAPQRAGILGSLNHAGKPLRMMPAEPAGRRIWTAREWAKQRRGWIFITSTPDTLDALRPLQSLWLDMLILKLQSGETQPGQKRVWMILDELAALSALPQLHAALTKQRKSDNPIVLGFQGMSQLDALYGKKAETILSQAYTNIVLRTREPRAAEHLSKLIGDAQLERVTESRPAHWFGHKRHSFTTQRVTDPVVMKSEIQGLEDLSGYFVQQDKVVAIRFRPRARRLRAEGLVERLIPAAQSQPAVRPAAAEQGRAETESPAEENETPEAVAPGIGMYVQ